MFFILFGAFPHFYGERDNPFAFLTGEDFLCFREKREKTINFGEGSTCMHVVFLNISRSRGEIIY